MKQLLKKSNRLVLLIFAIMSLVIIAGCESQDSIELKNLAATEENNKEFINTYTAEFWNKHDMDVFDTFYSADFVVHFAAGDQNREQYKELCQAYFAAFPDLHITTDDLLAEGDKVTKVWTANSTHKDEFMGIPATENKMVVKGIEVFRIADGKIAELWVSMDNLGMMQQMGVIPPMGE